MKISLKTKFLLFSLSLVLLTTVGLSIVYYLLSRQENQRDSRQRIQAAFNIIIDDISNRRDTYTKRLQEFLNENASLGRAVHFYNRDSTQLQSPDFTVIYLLKVVKDLKKFGRTMSINRLTLYALDKRLLMLYQQRDSQEDAGVYRISETGEDSYFSLSDRAQLLFSNQDMPTTSLPPGISERFTGDIPVDTRADFVSEGQMFVLRITAPVYRNAEIVGVLVCDIFSKQPMAERYAFLSKTDVNFFIGQQFSIGTLPGQTTFDLTSPASIALCESFATHDKQPDIISVTFNEKTYYQGQCLITSDNAPIGVITVNLSQQISQQTLQKVLVAVFVISGIALLVAGSLSWLLSHNLVKTIDKVVRSAEKISAGDLTHTLSIQGDREIRRLSLAFNRMAENLRMMTRHVKSAGDHIQASTQEILASTDQLASSLEQQSASVLQTSMTMEQVVAASQQIARSVTSVVQIAERTGADAQQGMNAAKDMIEKMQAIEMSNQNDTAHIQNLGQQSAEIANIMELIASIADQTKLIAFNASLEAAGAGEAGKRFRVVAAEIRHLADNVIEATGDIDQTLTDMQNSVQKLVHSSEISTQRIREGVDNTSNTATWLKEIVSGAMETTRAAQEISGLIGQQQLAGEEISITLKEISSSINQLTETGTMSRDTASQLNALSDDLEEAIKVLKL